MTDFAFVYLSQRKSCGECYEVRSLSFDHVHCAVRVVSSAITLTDFCYNRCSVSWGTLTFPCEGPQRAPKNWSLAGGSISPVEWAGGRKSKKQAREGLARLDVLCSAVLNSRDVARGLDHNIGSRQVKNMRGWLGSKQERLVVLPHS